MKLAKREQPTKSLSYLFSRPKCCNPNHLFKESKAANLARKKCLGECIRNCQCSSRCIPVSSLNDDGVVAPCLIHQDGQCKQFPLREMKKARSPTFKFCRLIQHCCYVVFVKLL
jgi:hypothetical protein